MKWWSRFLKKRRQSDRVKMICLFLLVGIGFTGDFIYRGIQVYQMLNSPAEYVLTNTAGKITDVQIAEIRELDHVKAVTRQQETTVTLTWKRKELTVTCLELSADYLQSVYGIQKSGSMMTFYLNPAAWEQLQQNTDEPSESEKDAEVLQAEYALPGETEKREMKPAKIMLFEEAGKEEQPCAFCSYTYVKKSDGAYQREGASDASSGKTEMVRVQVGQQDLDGMTLKHLSRLGFEAVDSGEVQQMALVQEMQFLRMRYDILVAGLSFLSVGCLKKLKSGEE